MITGHLFLDFIICIAAIWIVSGLGANWIWSGNPVDRKGAIENIKKLLPNDEK